jgi:hypothetical protein
MSGVCSSRKMMRHNVVIARAVADDDRGDNVNNSGMNEQMSQFRKRLVGERRRLENQRTGNFKELIAAVKKLADDEMEFVKQLVESTKSACNNGTKSRNDNDITVDEKK